MVSRFPLSASIVTVSVFGVGCDTGECGDGGGYGGFLSGGLMNGCGFLREGNDYVVSPDYTGVVVTLTATGGLAAIVMSVREVAICSGVDADTGGGFVDDGSFTGTVWRGGGFYSAG